MPVNDARRGSIEIAKKSDRTDLLDFSEFAADRL
jgi:hypothetical protein